MNNRTYRFTRHEPMFPFGFGLSYSNFIYSNLSINKQKIKSGDSIELNFEIHNDSEFLGEEVIQLYIKDMESSFRTPNSALKFFKRIKLKPGEKTRVNVLVNKEMYTVINKEGKIQSKMDIIKYLLEEPLQVTEVLNWKNLYKKCHSRFNEKVVNNHFGSSIV